MSNVHLLVESDIQVKDGQLICSSLGIAERFNKKHNHLLRDIQKLAEESEFFKNQIHFSSYVDTQGKSRPNCEITKDGFVLLVMGFSGREALKVKEAYIKEFNAMDMEIRSKLGNNLEHMQQYWTDQTDKITMLEENYDLQKKYITLLEQKSSEGERPKRRRVRAPNQAKRVTREEVLEVLRLRELNYTYREIAEKLGRSKGSVESMVYIHARIMGLR